MRPIKRAPIIIARVVPVITKIIIRERIIIIKRILVASEHKEGSKDRFYRLY